jgi:hypothetical protein
MDGIELADAVDSVRNQLIEAAARAAGRPLSFELGPVQMEFTVELRKEVKAGGKVKAWVVEAGADTARTSGHIHKVSFTLTPRDAATGSAWQVGNDSQGSAARFGQAPEPR